MTETPPNPLETGKPAKPAKPAKQEDSFPVFLLKLAVIVVVFRSFIFSPFNIPSESMLPRLMNGDYLLASKWSYGFSRYSLPFSVPLLPEHRLLASTPERGDVVIFKQPPLNDVDYIKRVIGLPGDHVQMKEGVLWLNGAPVPKVKIADFELPVSANTRCVSPQFEAKDADNNDVCRYPRYRETLPGGRSYEVLDLGTRPQDDTIEFIVPEGHLFLMGDNRDNSADSRATLAERGLGGPVPFESIGGRAEFITFSVDGSTGLNPLSWWSSLRGGRAGASLHAEGN